jgi:hypothetical protein
MIELPLDIDDALRKFEQIPCVQEVFNPAHLDFINELLEATAGSFKSGIKVYRVYIAAMRYIQQNPDSFRIKKHHKTELNDFSPAIAMLQEMQRSQDLAFNLIAPLGQESYTPKTTKYVMGSMTLIKNVSPP